MWCGGNKMWYCGKLSGVSGVVIFYGLAAPHEFKDQSFFESGNNCHHKKSLIVIIIIDHVDKNMFLIKYICIYA